MSVLRQLLPDLQRKKKEPDFWLYTGLISLFWLAMWPLSNWFMNEVSGQSRLLNVAVVLIIATYCLVRFGQIDIIRPLEPTPGVVRTIAGAYGLLGLTYLHHLSPELSYTKLLIVPAYCIGLMATLRFIFGEGVRRITRTVAITLGALMLATLLMANFDWPLRTLAGQWSAAVLQWFGKTVNLGLVGEAGGPPMLMLFVEKHPFHVAPECNGFGVILTSFLIALLLGIYQKLRAFDLMLNLAVGLLIGFIFNITRIVIIVLLAPSLMDHYHLMHEIVGGVAFWACLLSVWFLLGGPFKESLVASKQRRWNS